MSLLENIRRECRQQPVAVVSGAVAILSVVVNLLVYGLSLDPRQLRFSSDIALLFTLCAVILTQGTVGFVFSRLNVSILRLGTGFPILLLAISILFMSWLLSFNAFWFAGYAAAASNVTIRSWYPIALAASWPGVLYFQVHAFLIADTKLDDQVDIMIMLFFVICYMIFGTWMGGYFSVRLGG